MSKAERRDADRRARESIAALDVRNAEREPILNGEVVARIGAVLSDAEVAYLENLSIDQWNVVMPDGKAIELRTYPTKRGRVGSADVFAHDSVKITYKEGEGLKTAFMKGISGISLLKDDDGTVSVEFVQKTDKGTDRIEVSDKGVAVGGNGTRWKIPHRFIKEFYFI